MDQIFASLVSDSLVISTKNFTFEEVITEARKVRKEMEKLIMENYKLKAKLDGFDSGDESGGEPTITEVD